MKKDLQLKVKVEIANLVKPSLCEEVELTVDTGAAFSVIKRDKLKRLKVSPVYKRKMRLANGEVIERDIGACWFNIGDKGRIISNVIFGEKGDIELLGLHTLEGMGLTVDAKTGELRSMELFLL